jgi:catechol-2,3-dioxygenase
LERPYAVEFEKRRISMAEIRHLAIKTEDTHRLATFYKEVFDLQELYREKREGGAIFLTDGYFNMAILPNDDQNARNGLYHFGFEVEDSEEVAKKIEKLNMSRRVKPRPNSRPYAETRGSDPDGNFFDISENGFLELRPARKEQDAQR